MSEKYITKPVQFAAALVLLAGIFLLCFVAGPLWKGWARQDLAEARLRAEAESQGLPVARVREEFAEEFAGLAEAIDPVTGEGGAEMMGLQPPRFRGSLGFLGTDMGGRD